MPQAQQYDTPLSPSDEKQFQTWKAQYAPKDSGEDYDLRGAYKAGLTPDPKTGHWPDTFKKPNHPTFSDESKYAKDRPDLAGHWEGTGKNARYIPPKRSPMAGPSDIQNPPDTQNLPVGTRTDTPQGPGPTGPPPPPQAPQPSPQQADIVHHAALGKMVKAIMGTQTSYKVNPVTGQTEEARVPNTPGQWGKSMVLGAMLGLAGAADHKAQGGGVGGFMGGFGLGGTAVAEHGEQQDLLKRHQAEQEYKNQLVAKQEQREQSKEQREEEAFKTEEQLKHVQILGANMGLVEANQRIAKGTLEQIEDLVKNDSTYVEPFKQLGIPAVKENATKNEVNEVLKNNPQATGWQYFGTGWKPVKTADGSATWEPTFSIYDTSARIPLTKSMIDQMEKNGVGDVNPKLIGQLRAMQAHGKEFTAKEYSAFIQMDRKAYTDKLTKTKDELGIEKEKAQTRDLDAQSRERLALAAREDKKDKASQLYAKAMGDWQSAINEAREDNPDISDEEVFEGLDKDAKGAITAGLNKEVQELDKEITQDLNPLTYDPDAAKDAMKLRSQYRRLQGQVFGSAKKAAGPDLKMPIAVKRGDHPSQDIADAFIAKYSTPEEAKAAMVTNGFDPSAIEEQKEASQWSVENLKRGTEAVSGAVKKALKPGKGNL